jgi:hypothetical protein
MPQHVRFPKANYISVRSEIPTAVGANVAILWDIAPCNPYVNRRFGGTYHLHFQGKVSTATNRRFTLDVNIISGPLHSNNCTIHTIIISIHLTTKS